CHGASHSGGRDVQAFLRETANGNVRLAQREDKEMGKWEIPPRGGQMDLPSGIYYQTMTGHQVKERLKKNDLIIIPVGSTENHGEHACPGEDTFLVTRMAEQVAKATGCTVAEPIWY